MHFTDQLAALRTRRRMSLAAIGGRIGMAVPNLSAILRGRGDTKASTLAAVASALEAEWVLVPKEQLQHVRHVLERDAEEPASADGVAAPRSIEMFTKKQQ